METGTDMGAYPVRLTNSGHAVGYVAYESSVSFWNWLEVWSRGWVKLASVCGFGCGWW